MFVTGVAETVNNVAPDENVSNYVYIVLIEYMTYAAAIQCLMLSCV